MIGIITPHLFSIDGAPSPNIGDLIIYNYLSKELKSLFPSETFYNFPLHASLNHYHKFLLTKCDLIFITGSNFLAPRTTSQRRALLSIDHLGIVNKVIFMGAGWSGSELHELDKETTKFYQRILHRSYPHSVRDSLSLQKFSKIGLSIINTSCPTMWPLNSRKYNRIKLENDCLFTLTDYSINITEDQAFLDLLLSKFQKLYYFPQGRYDLEYLNSLDLFKSNRNRFLLLDRSLNALDDFTSNDFTYIGTRLHCGIHMLNNNKDALILAVDNRSRNIAKDTKLPVCNRGDLNVINQWIDGVDVFDEFSLPKSWNGWKDHFRK